MARHLDEEETKLVRNSTRRNARNKTEKGLICLLAISILTFVCLIGLLVAILINSGATQTTRNSPISTKIEPTLPPKLARKVSRVINNKILAENREFLQRFPRDHRYVSKKMLAFFPQPLELTKLSDRPDNDDKASEIFYSVDENHDGSTDPWELHDWMLFVESHVHKHILDQQWHTLGQAENANLTWPDFVFKVRFAL